MEDDEFRTLIDGTMERVYLLKLCVEQGAETREEMAAIARAAAMSEYAEDPKVWKALIDGTMERVYLLKLCVEQGAETREEMAAIARAAAMSEYAEDPKVWKALSSWNAMWHEL